MNKSVKDNIFLTLMCEWGDCVHVYDRMDYYIQHVNEHINDWKAKTEIDLTDLDNKENRLTCLWKDCSSETKLKSIEELVQHVNYHAFHQKLKCHGIALLQTLSDSNSRCQLDQGSRNFLPDLPFKLICHWENCRESFENPEYFYSHVINHIDKYPVGNDVKGGCKCHWETCQTSVKSKHKLKNHLRSHTQEKLFACPTCGGLFANATKFVDHVQRQAEPNALTYRCSYCSKMFPNKRFLRDHMRHHVYHYKCPFCDMTCPNPSSLRTHIRYRHSDLRPFICKECGFKAKLAVDLKKHMESHETDWIECMYEDCSYRSRFAWDINLHVKNKHQGLEESKYLCHLCSQKYTRGAYLTKHLKKKHRLREPSGHVRLRYKLHDDGFYRLQEFRYESSELQEQHMALQNDDTEEQTTTRGNVADDHGDVEDDRDKQDNIPMDDDDDDDDYDVDYHEMDGVSIVEEEDVLYEIAEGW